MEAACVGKQQCTVSATTTVFGDPCYGTKKALAVVATCSAVPTAAVYTMRAVVPFGVSATVAVPLIHATASTATILEGSDIVWQNGKYDQPGTKGLSGGQYVAADNAVEFTAGSGTYVFKIEG